MSAPMAISAPAAAAASRSIPAPNGAPAPSRRRNRGTGIMARQQPIELFMPPNMLKAKAGGGFGGVDLGAIKRAETAMDGLKDEFAGMAGGSIAPPLKPHAPYAANPAPASRAALLRTSLDLKGMAATFGFPLMARVAGSLAKLLSEAPEGKPLPLKLVEAHVAAVQVIQRSNITMPDHKGTLALLAELE